jgi:hypothetical protein
MLVLRSLPRDVSLSRQVAVPAGDFHHDVRRTIRHALAGEPRLRREAVSVIQLVFLVFARLAATGQPLANDHMTRRTRADAAARVIEVDPVAQGDVQDAARLAVIAVGQIGRVNLHDSIRREKPDAISTLRQAVAGVGNVRVLVAHAHLISRPIVR